jgi:hypothetical protein
MEERCGFCGGQWNYSGEHQEKPVLCAYELRLRLLRLVGSSEHYEEEVTLG